MDAPDSWPHTAWLDASAKLGGVRLVGLCLHTPFRAYHIELIPGSDECVA